MAVAATYAPTAAAGARVIRRAMARRLFAVMPCHRAPPSRVLIEELKRWIPDVLVVSDGIPRELAGELVDLVDATGVELLPFSHNRGKGHAVEAGVRHLLARDPAPESVLVLDSDGQHPPAAIPGLLEAGAHADLVIGDRFGDRASMPWKRRAANLIASRILAATTGKQVRDSQCGMRLLRGRALHEIPFPDGGYEAETQHLKRCLQAGVDVAWVADAGDLRWRAEFVSPAQRLPPGHWSVASLAPASACGRSTPLNLPDRRRVQGIEGMKRLFDKLMGDQTECEETRALMSDHVEDDLDAEGQERVEDHSKSCRRCRNMLARLHLGPFSPWRA